MKALYSKGQYRVHYFFYSGITGIHTGIKVITLPKFGFISGAVDKIFHYPFIEGNSHTVEKFSLIFVNVGVHGGMRTLRINSTFFTLILLKELNTELLYGFTDNIYILFGIALRNAGLSEQFGTMLQFMRFKGKTALVTGGVRRLGKEIALSLAREGADIILHYFQSRQEADETSDEIRSFGRECRMSSQDFSDVNLTRKWFGNLIGEYGCPDILINSASSYSKDTYRNMSVGRLQDSMNLHVYAPLVLIRMMFEAGRGGSVVNLLDTRVADRDPFHASYHLGKRGLLTITRDLAAEFAPVLRINAVAPGIVLPPEGQGEDWIERLKSTNPLLERGTAQDVSDAVLFLVGAEFTTGQIIFVDGGRHLKGNAYGL